MSAQGSFDRGKRPVAVAAFLLVTALFVGMLYSGAYGEGKVSAPGCPSGSVPGSGPGGSFPGSGPGGSFPGSGPGGSFPGSGPGGSFPGSGPGSLPGSGPGGSCPGVSEPGSQPGSEPGGSEPPPPPPPPCPPGKDKDKRDKDKDKDKPDKDKDGDGCPDKDEDKGNDDKDKDEHQPGGPPTRGPMRLGLKPLPGQKLRAVLRTGLKLELTCPTACRGRAQLLVNAHVRASRLAHEPVGKGDRRLKRAGRTVVVVKVKRRWRSRFRRVKSVKLTLRTRATSAAGDSVRNRRMTIRR